MSKAELQLPKYYEDPSALHIGCEENRSYYIPYAPDETEYSSRVIMLNGDWDFRYYENPFELEDFTQPGYLYQNYDTIPVPGCIQMYGYDHHQYTNTNFPFPYDPPYVPLENPTCVYHRSFMISRDQLKFTNYLNFEGVDSCFYVYINQTFVGYSQVSHSTSEFDISSYIKEGSNDITVVVLKWCNGSYLEDQDKFRMTGIFRDVYLLQRPKDHIRDFFVKTLLTDSYHKAEVTVDFSFTNSKLPISSTLTDADGLVVSEQTITDSTLSIILNNPILWNAENPYLYTLTITTPDEVIYQKVGIRSIEVKKDIIYINGISIKFKGVNRHDSDPVTGYTISKEQAMKDLKLMKEANINAIRTSHYPNAPWFTGLCSLYGFYVVGESDLEAHGALDFYGAKFPDTYGDLVQREIFTKAILDRNQRNVIRDKNNPCIILWSMGNEAGYSKAFEDTGRWIKAYDPTRLLHYEGSIHQSGGHINDTSMLDVFSNMYASVADIEKYLANNPKPYMLCEFVHAMGNGPGDIEDYMDCIYAHDRFVGGFVWEWCDHAIDRGITLDGRKIYHYGGDTGEYPHDENFCVDGMVFPDRKPHPAYFEYKNAIRPVRARLVNAQDGSIELENKLDFTNLKNYITITAELLYDGEVAETIQLDPVDLQPHCKSVIRIPYSTSYLTDPDKKLSLTLRLIYTQVKAAPLTGEGHELGFDQLFLKESTAAFIHAGQNNSCTATAASVNNVSVNNVNINNINVNNVNINNAIVNTDGQTDKPQANSKTSETTKIEIEESGAKIIVKGPNYNYCFNKLHGCFDSIVVNQQTILEQPLEFNIWRAPTDNDSSISHSWRKARYNRAVTRVYETAVLQEEQTTIIRCRLAITAIQIQHILDLDVTWYIAKDGTLTVQINGKRDPLLPFLPRFGLRFFLPAKFQRVNYLGYGPNESYIDKHRSSWYGRFDDSVDNQYVDYIKPQENSSHYNCSDLTLSSKYGSRIHITAAEPFSFQAGRYTQEELQTKGHNYELCKSSSTILCLDYKMSGVGSNSCGPALSEKYQLREEDISFQATLQFYE